MYKNSQSYATLIALGIIIVFVLKFITPLAFAALLAYLLWPLHKKIAAKTNEVISALLLTLFIVVILGFITFSGLNFILNESANAYTYLSKVNFEELFPGEDGLALTLKDATRFVLTNLISYLSGWLKEIPAIILNFFVFLGALFYLIIDGNKIINWLKDNIKWFKKEMYLNEVKNYTDVFIKVWLIIAVLQGIATAIGFFIFDLPYALLAGIVSGILSFLPIVGPYILYVPITVVLLASNNIAIGIGILIYGLAVGSFLDYIIRPHFAGKWSRIHPLIILVGILSGMALLGPAGLIIGPILLFSSVLMIKTSIKQFKA